MNTSRSIAPAALSLVAAIAAGCGGPPAGTGGGSAPDPTLSQQDQLLHQDLLRQLTEIINEQTERYTPLQYDYSEGLLEILDQVEPFLSGEAEGEPPRFMPGLEPEEELAHLRESVRRWEAKTGKELRPEIDRFKAEIEARDPARSAFPEFHAAFSRSFDDFIAIEVAELRERANRAIHADADALLAPHRESSPEVVRRIEAMLNVPPYNLTGSETPGQPRPDAEAEGT